SVWSDFSDDSALHPFHYQKYVQSLKECDFAPGQASSHGLTEGSSDRPHILPGHLTGPRYLIFLEQVLPKLLDRVPRYHAVTRTSMWFQQDAIPRTFQYFCSESLDAVCGERWIGREVQCIDFSDRQTFPVWIISSGGK
ncbi:hypothetical protein TNCV_3112381, partial [Trichonephila clavipes]